MSQHRLAVAFFTLLVIVHCCHGRSHFKRQSTSAAAASSRADHVSLCQSTDPCGWVVYDPATRRIVESRKNPACRCDKEHQRCLMTQTDVSISAYVYRCLPATTSGNANNL